MKYKGILIVSAVFFFMMNFNYFWERDMGVYAMFFALAMLGFFIVLCLFLLAQLSIAIREQFSDKQRLWALGVLGIVLIPTYLQPGGMINFDGLSGTKIFVAQREGAANCMTYLKLSKSNQFIFEQNCFSTSRTTGDYELKNDSIFFTNVSLGRNTDSFYRFGVIKNSFITNEISREIQLYYSGYDSSGYSLFVTKDLLHN